MAEYCDSGKTRVERYKFSGETKKEGREETREVHCFRAILSEHDLERVGGASPRAGLRRTMPRLEKKPLPRRVISKAVAGVGTAAGTGVGVGSAEEVEERSEIAGRGETIGGSGGGASQGEGSTWAVMVSSMLASPPWGGVLVSLYYVKKEEEGGWEHTRGFGAVHVESHVGAPGKSWRVP